MAAVTAPIDSCRLAYPAEAATIAALQRRVWDADLPADLARAMLAGVDLDAMTQAWTTAITRPPLAQFRVLVAVSDTGRVAGFAAVGPSADPDATPGQDALVGEFAIDPQFRRLGHGSRLLNAVADTLRADGFARATWWVRSTDDATRAFVTASGWDADGAHRELEGPDGVTAKQVRLHTAL